MPTPTPGEFGQWMIGLVALATIVVLVLTGINQAIRLFHPSSPPQGKDLVTSGELDRVESRLKVEIQRVETDSGAKMTKLQDYCRERFHELNDSVHALQLQVTKFPIVVREAVDAALLPVMTKLDKHTDSLADLKGRIIKKEETEI